MDITTETAAKVTAAIAAAGETKNSIAEKSGIPYATLWRKANGHAPFTVKEIGQLADALRVLPQDLLPAGPAPTEPAEQVPA